MCQLIVKPAGVTISVDVLRDAWRANDDGAGFAYRDEKGVVYLVKGFFKFKKFWHHYRKFQHLDALIHFRFATHGEKVVENCHPFVVAEQAVIGHNGILYSYQPIGVDKRSDTRVFVDSFLTPALTASKLSPAEFFACPGVKALIETHTRGSKFAVLSPSGFTIFNESAGTWKDGVWYSAGYPPDEKWCYDWRDYIDGQWNRTKSIVKTWTKDMIHPLDKEGWKEETAGSGGTTTTGTVPLCLTERCELCNEETERLYYVAQERLCHACWNAFYGAE